MNDLKEINKFVNDLWKFIKQNEIPAQNDNEAWEYITEESEKLVKNYKTSRPMDRLFVAWVVAYLQYMSDVSKGIPTLMQEAKEVAKEV